MLHCADASHPDANARVRMPDRVAARPDDRDVARAVNRERRPHDKNVAGFRQDLCAQHRVIRVSSRNRSRNTHCPPRIMPARIGREHRNGLDAGRKITQLIEDRNHEPNTVHGDAATALSVHVTGAAPTPEDKPERLYDADSKIGL